MSEALDRLLIAGLLNPADVAQATGASLRTVQRWASGRNEPARAAESKLLELAAVAGQAQAAVGGGAQAVREWMRSPNGRLGWDVPLDAIREGRFRDAIAALPAAEQQSA